MGLVWGYHILFPYLGAGYNGFSFVEMLDTHNLSAFLCACNNLIKLKYRSLSACTLISNAHFAKSSTCKGEDLH